MLRRGLESRTGWFFVLPLSCVDIVTSMGPNPLLLKIVRTVLRHLHPALIHKYLTRHAKIINLPVIGILMFKCDVFTSGSPFALNPLCQGRMCLASHINGVGAGRNQGVNYTPEITLNRITFFPRFVIITASIAFN